MPKILTCVSAAPAGQADAGIDERWRPVIRIMGNDNPFVGRAIRFGTRTATALCMLAMAGLALL